MVLFSRTDCGKIEKKTTPALAFAQITKENRPAGGGVPDSIDQYTDAGAEQVDFSIIQRVLERNGTVFQYSLLNKHD